MIPENRTLYVADNLSVLRGMDSGVIDCIATDPPFNTGRVFKAGASDTLCAGQTFDDRWSWEDVNKDDDWQNLEPTIKAIIEVARMIEGGKSDHPLAAYLAFMSPRLAEMHRVLKPSGVLFLHCDTQAHSYLRLILDAIFGRRLIINEITVRRNGAKMWGTRRLPRNRDVVLAYGKSRKWKWNPSYEPYDLARLDKSTLAQYNKMEGGRRYRLCSMTNPNPDRPNLTYEFMGVTRVWRWTKERMQATFDAGRIVQTSPGCVPRSKAYLDEQPGKMRDDIWNDLGQPESRKIEWATRKPLALYRRLIECATDRGDLVLDPFSGSATTCVAAEQTQRRWVGIDVDPVAERVTLERMQDEIGLDMTAQPVTVHRHHLNPSSGRPI